MFNFRDDRCKETEKFARLALQQYYEPIMPMFISPNSTEIKCRCKFSRFFPLAPRERKHYTVRKLQSLGKRDVGRVSCKRAHYGCIWDPVLSKQPQQILEAFFLPSSVSFDQRRIREQFFLFGLWQPFHSQEELFSV